MKHGLVKFRRLTESEMKSDYQSEPSTGELVDEMKDIAERLKRIIQHYKQTEGLIEGVDVNFDYPYSIREAISRFNAAKRALGIANRLRDPEQRRYHKSRVVTMINKLRGALKQIEKVVRL